MIWTHLIARWRPSILVTVRHDAWVFTARDTLVAAPVIWLDPSGQISAVGENGHAMTRGWLRIDLVRSGGVLRETGEVGEKAALFLRYAFTFASMGHPMRQWLRPAIFYVETARPDQSTRSLMAQRRAAFRGLALRAGAHDIQFSDVHEGYAASAFS